MGTLEMARAKAQASLSQATADVKKLEADLSAAQAKASIVKAGETTLGVLTSAPVIRQGTEFLRRRTEADSAAASAEVDRITADLNAAQNRLKWAQRTSDALEAVSTKVSDLIDSLDNPIDPTEAPPVEAEAAIEIDVAKPDDPQA
ncbi:MAG: hypothetical protein U0904_07315 [Candidatus Nanopelagicales bacterium]|nr:hypothetical protein [Candidatus Nanopelagicales bacterium]